MHQQMLLQMAVPVTVCVAPHNQPTGAPVILSNSMTGPTVARSSHTAMRASPTAVISRTFLGSSQLTWMEASTSPGYCNVAKLTSWTFGCKKAFPTADTSTGTASRRKL